MFGMGTGGSLRLLSPEIQGCSRTLKTAQVFVSPGSASLRPTKASLRFTGHSFTNHLPWFVFVLVELLSSQL